MFEDERAELRPLGRVFDGDVEKTVRVRSTCLVQYASNRYSVPSRFAGQHVSLRAYASRIMLVSGQDIITEHKRRFTHTVSYFEPWHHVPLLDRKPGALREMAPPSWIGNCPKPCTGSDNITCQAKAGIGGSPICFC